MLSLALTLMLGAEPQEGLYGTTFETQELELRCTTDVVCLERQYRDRLAALATPP